MLDDPVVFGIRDPASRICILLIALFTIGADLL